MNIKKVIKRIVLFLNCLKHRVPLNCRIESHTKLKKCKLKGRNMILRGTHVEQCHVGYGTFIGRNCSFYKTTIGSYCSIGEEVKLVFGDHPKHIIVSTHPAFYSTDGQYGFTYTKTNLFEEYKKLEEDKLLYIGNDVWIGSFVKIVSGISIGDGAIIGTGAIVTKNVEPYSVVAGSPAKEIYKRFSEEQISKLLSLKWWDKGEDWIKDNIDLFSNIDIFLEQVNDGK